MEAVVQRTGLTELYKPSDEHDPILEYVLSYECRPTTRLTVNSVIFVHGLFGHPKNIWTCNTVTGVAEGELPPQPSLRKSPWGGRQSEEVYFPWDLLSQVFASGSNYDVGLRCPN